MIHHSCPNCCSLNTKLIIGIPELAMEFQGVNFLVPEHTGKKREWYYCHECSIYFSIPRLTEKQIHYMYEHYRSEVYRQESPDEYFDRITRLPESESENLAKLKYILKYNPLLNPNSCLDIGCGAGVFINTLKSHWNSCSFYGVEPSKNFATVAQERNKANIFCGYFHDYILLEATLHVKFDLITCCQVLEHVPDPVTFLKSILNKMHSSSILYLEVPDSSDFSDLPKNHSRFTEPSHLWYFSYDYLQKTLRDCGLIIEHYCICETVRKRNNLQLILKRNSK